MTALYRARQFWYAMQAAPSREDLENVSQVLSPSLMSLFSSMQPGEQVHSLKVFYNLSTDPEASQELLSAALLHDIGKSRQPLRLWERVLVVIGQAVCPQMASKWGAGDPKGWKRAFVVAARHAQWGADLAASAGAAPLIVSLIRRHRDKVLNSDGYENRLLIQLQRVDNES